MSKLTADGYIRKLQAHPREEQYRKQPCLDTQRSTKGKIVEPEYCRNFLSWHPMRCINDCFYTVDGPLPDESKLKRTIYAEISPWIHPKVAQTVEQIIKALKLATYADSFAPAM